MIRPKTGSSLKNNLGWLCPLVLFLTAQIAFAAEEGLLSQILLTGSFFCRHPDCVAFSPYVAGEKLPANSILVVRSSIENPLATNSALLVGSHTVTFYPGASVRLMNNGIMPLSGRFSITSSEAAEPVNIFADRFSGSMLDGSLLIEITPDDGAYVAMKNAGSAWFKDRERKVFELNNTRELHFPLFGKTLEQSSLSGFWSVSPSSFAKLRPGWTGEQTASSTASATASATVPVSASAAASLQPSIDNPAVASDEMEIAP